MTRSDRKETEDMIRKFQETDIDAVMRIWLESNTEAHDFIPSAYWEEHFAQVGEMLPRAEVYVLEEQKFTEILGFIGLNGDHIEGIFVRRKARSQGAGKQLLDFVKKIRSGLTLHVYQKNRRAVRFYRREDFTIQKEDIDPETGEAEYIMEWKKTSGAQGMPDSRAQEEPKV